MTKVTEHPITVKALELLKNLFIRIEGNARTTWHISFTGVVEGFRHLAFFELHLVEVTLM